MAQVTGHELFARYGLGLDAVVVGAVLVAEGHRVFITGHDAGIRDRGAANVSGQIFDGLLSGAERLDVHAPVLAPDGGIDFPALLVEQLAEVLAKSSAQGRVVEQEVGILDRDDLAAQADARTGHQEMDVGMEEQPLVPGVEHAGEAVDGGVQALAAREFLGECPGGGGKEQVVGVLGVGAEEEVAQFGR